MGRLVGGRFVGRFDRVILIGAALCALPMVVPTLSVAATAAPSAESALPPALRAAVLSGNVSAITQAISSLAGGNPAREATLALTVAQAAQHMVATNPQAAVNAAAAAVQIISNESVSNAAPSNALQTAVAAAKVIVQPEVQRIAPSTAGQVATTLAQVVTSPAVYQASPSAALQVMSNAYATATSATVATALPSAAAAVTQTLTAAAQNTALAAANTGNNADVNAILAHQVTTPQTQPQTQGGGQQTASNTQVPTESQPPSFTVSPN